MGKSVCAWTVNDREEMRECARWGLKSVISDRPAVWMEVKAEVRKPFRYGSQAGLIAEIDREGPKASSPADDPDVYPAVSVQEELLVRIRKSDRNH